MKPGDLYEVTACGPESNPKDVNYHLTNMGWLKYGEFYNYAKQKFGIYWTDRGGNIMHPDFWLKPVGKTEEQIQREAFEAGNDSWANKTELNYTFYQWRSEYLKQQDR